MDCQDGYPARFGTSCPRTLPEESKTVSDTDALKAENDRLKQELAESKKTSMSEIWTIYVELVKGDEKKEQEKRRTADEEERI